MEDGRSKWQNSVQWARNALVKKGIIQTGGPRGFWKLTEKGVSVAKGLVPLPKNIYKFKSDYDVFREPDNLEYHEGIVSKVFVNRYERNKKARMACINHYGCKCMACGFDFEKVYGRIGTGFIHVHHIVPLSSITENYKVNPIEDLIPLCPNCHFIVHRQKNEVLSVEKLRTILNKT